MENPKILWKNYGYDRPVYQNMAMIMFTRIWVCLPKNDGTSPFLMNKSPCLMDKSQFLMNITIFSG